MAFLVPLTPLSCNPLSWLTISRNHLFSTVAKGRVTCSESMFTMKPSSLAEVMRVRVPAPAPPPGPPGTPGPPGPGFGFGLGGWKNWRRLDLGCLGFVNMGSLLAVGPGRLLLYRLNSSPYHSDPAM